MTTHAPGTVTATAAELEAARLVLARMGLSPADLLTAPRVRPPVPTFAEYVPLVSAAVTDGTRRVYGSYWNRVLDHWGHRRLDEPTPSQIKQLVEHVKATVVARGNARSGRGAGEHLIAALRCLYRHAEDDGLIDPADNPARHQFDFCPGDILIVDEAAMSGTHTLHDVVRYALRRGADVRLVGDDKQFGAVEAGGAIRLIAHDVGAVRFREVVRFADPDQAAASLQIRAGNPAGLDYYLDNNWVASGSRETMRDAAQRHWRADLDAGRQTLLIVPTNDDVVSLNTQARAQRLQRGDIGAAQAVTLHDGTAASVGDWIVTRHNNRQLSVFAGQDDPDGQFVVGL
ncbi:MAG: AAA family ATPase [Pseudonocardiaceae bacterium]